MPAPDGRQAAFAELRSRARQALVRQAVAIAAILAVVLAGATVGLLLLGRGSWWPDLGKAAAVYVFYLVLAELYGALDLYVRYRRARSRVVLDSPLEPPHAGG